MSQSTSRSVLAGIALGALTLFLAGTASAESAQIKAGTLTCEGKGGIGLIVGSQEKLSCAYEPVDGGAKRFFEGTITRVGLDIGIRGKSIMVWTVLGSTTQLPAEALSGTFAGASGEVSAGIGGGANVLVGGNKKSVVLQPLSVKAQTGVNLAVGVAGLKLTPVAN